MKSVVFFVAWLVGAGCGSVEYRERLLRLTVVTSPAGAAVSVLANGAAESRRLGLSPLKFEHLVIARKTYPRGVSDYWLRDPAHVLPQNPGKPWYASPAYSAGNDYPLDLWFVASLPGYQDVASSVRVNRWILESLYAEPVPEIRIDLQLKPLPSPPAPPAKAGSPKPPPPPAQESIPQPR